MPIFSLPMLILVLCSFFIPHRYRQEQLKYLIKLQIRDIKDTRYLLIADKRFKLLILLINIYYIQVFYSASHNCSENCLSCLLRLMLFTFSTSLNVVTRTHSINIGIRPIISSGSQLLLSLLPIFFQDIHAAVFHLFSIIL